MQLFFAPPRRGWLLARPTSHTVLFQAANGRWVESAGEARHFDNRLIAHRAAGNDPEISVVHQNMVDWIKPALIQVKKPALVAR